MANEDTVRYVLQDAYKNFAYPPFEGQKRRNDALAALAQLVARLEQAEQERDELVSQASRREHEAHARGYRVGRWHEELESDDLAGLNEEAQRWWERLLAAESALAACEAERDQWKAVASEVGVLTLTESLAACEHSRDDALAALHYIKQRYGPLDGVGWNRLTGDEA